MPDEDVSLKNLGMAGVPSLGLFRESLGDVARERKAQQEFRTVTRVARHLATLARFALLVLVYGFLMLATLASLDSDRDGNKAPSINFAYKVF